MLELTLLNAILNSRDASSLVRFGLMDETQWLTHKSVYKYAVKHLEEFGELPSINSVIENTDNFEVTDPGESIETLAKKLVERNVKNAQKQFFVETAQQFGELSASEIIEKMEAKTQEFRNQSMSQGKNGVDWSNSGAERLAEFERRKKHDFSRRIPFFFQELTEALGEMSGGFYLAYLPDVSLSLDGVVLKPNKGVYDIKPGLVKIKYNGQVYTIVMTRAGT